MLGMLMIHRLKEAYRYITKRLAILVIKSLCGKVETYLSFDGKVDSIVILGQERYGDLIVLTPVIKKLRQSYPQSKIIVLGVTSAVSFLADDPNLNMVVNIKRASAKKRKEILRDHYDILFNTKDHPSVTFLWLTARIRARFKIGIYHPIHRGYFNYMHYYEDAAPTLDKNMAILHFLDILYDKNDLRPYLPAKTPTVEIKNFVAELGGKKPLGINLSASNPGKEWPLEHWKRLLSELIGPFIILSMPDDAARKALLERTFSNVIASPSTPTLTDAGYLIRHLKLLITTDTALVHVAGCHNIPVIVLYRLARDMKKFPPTSDRNQVHISPTTNLGDILPAEIIRSTRDML